MAKKSLVDEIIESMETYLKAIESGDAHFDEANFRNKRGAARYAVADLISHAKALKEARHWKRVHPKKKPIGRPRNLLSTHR